MLGLHGLDDFLERFRIVPVTFENLVSDRQSFTRHHQADAHLFAVRTFVARMPPLGLRVGVGLPFEIRGGHVVQQKLVLGIEQRRELLLEVFLDGVFLLEQMVVSPIEPVLVDLLIRHPQQIIQGRPFVPCVRDVQFARRFTEASQRKDGRHGRPWDAFMVPGNDLF